jgi:hypothetical protein
MWRIDPLLSCDTVNSGRLRGNGRNIHARRAVFSVVRAGIVARQQRGKHTQQ